VSVTVASQAPFSTFSHSTCSERRSALCRPMLLSAGVGSEREPSSTAQLAGASRGRYKLGDMYTTVYVYDSDFPSRSSKLSSRSLRLGNKELLHTTQLQRALYTASGERRQLGIVPSCLRIILSRASVWFEGNE
jgi:hypothetical protein